MGWLLDYVARLLKYYPQMGYEKVWFRFPMAKGYALIAAAALNDGWLQFSGIELADGGYIRQEMDKIKK